MLKTNAQVNSSCCCCCFLFKINKFNVSYIIMYCNLQMTMKLKQIVATCPQPWCVVHQVPALVTYLMSSHQAQSLHVHSLFTTCPQLHRHPFYSHPLHPLQIISCHLLTCLCGDVKKSAVEPSSGDLMVRSLWTPSFWTLCVHALAVPGPLWILVRQRL